MGRNAQRLGVEVNVCVVWLHDMPTQSLGACGTAAAYSCLMDPALASDWLPAPKYPPRLNTLSNELCRGAVRLALSCHPQWLAPRNPSLPLLQGAIATGTVWNNACFPVQKSFLPLAKITICDLVQH